MVGAQDRLALGRERLDRVTRDEERRRQVQRMQAVEKSRHADAGPYSPRCNIAGVTGSWSSQTDSASKSKQADALGGIGLTVSSRTGGG